ncbi:DUR3 [Symbiodinium microadriaticum]|nr:DUR3 [Symbiodinium microadriaticum]
MDEKIDKLEDRFLSGELQNLVVPLPSAPVVPAASKVHFLQGKPSTVSTTIASPDDELDALLHRVDGMERRLIRGPPSDRLEGIASALSHAPARAAKVQGLAFLSVHVMQPFMTSPGMEEFQHGLGVFLGYDGQEDVLSGPVAENWDEACVTMAYRKGSGVSAKAVTFPACRGSAFITAEFRSVRPVVSSDLMLAEPKKLLVDGKQVDCSDFVHGKEIEFTLSTGDSWLVVFPPGMGWVCKAWPFRLLAAKPTPPKGAAVQLAMLKGKNPGLDVQRWHSLVRQHSGAYPVASGLNFKVGLNADDAEVSFNWADYVRTVPGYHEKELHFSEMAELISDFSSPVWTATAENIASSMLHEQRLKAGFPNGLHDVQPNSVLQLGDETNLTDEEAIDRVIRHGVLSERQRQALAREHLTVQRAIAKVLQLDYVGGHGGSFAQNLQGHRHGHHHRHKRGRAKASSAPPEGPSDAGECLAQVGTGLDKDELKAVLQKKETTANIGLDVVNKMEKTLKQTVTEGVTNASQALYNFVTKRLVWTIAVKAFPTPWAWPSILFGCGPLYQCTKELLVIVEPLRQLIWKTVAAMAKLVNWMLNTFTSYFGGETKQVAEPNADLEPNLHHLFSDTEILGLDCIKCSARLAAGITVDAIPPLAVSVLTNSATITEIVGSENNVVKQCYGTCLKKQMQVLNRIITGGGNADTDQYFKRGNCNQHAVGMCLVLEKTRECKMEVLADGTLRTEATFKEGADAQRNVCNALKGVHLHLIRDEERGIICPENKHKGSKMDLGHACHKVMDELMLYNQMCESHEEEQGWTSWAMSVGTVPQYKDEKPINSWDDAKHKCLELFGCTSLLTKPDKPDVQRGLEAFKNVLREILDSAPRDFERDQIMKTVDEWRSKSMAGADAFEIVAQEWVAHESEEERMAWVRDDENLKKIFEQDIWRDHCFAFGKPMTTEFDSLYKNYAKPDMAFFDALTREMGLTEWGSSKCAIPTSGTSR